MKVWTITHICENEVTPFVTSFRTKTSAVRAVEGHASELFEAMVDPNSSDRQVFPGLDWNDDFSRAFCRPLSAIDECYLVTETVVQ